MSQTTMPTLCPPSVLISDAIALLVSHAVEVEVALEVVVVCSAAKANHQLEDTLVADVVADDRATSVKRDRLKRAVP